MVIDGARSWSVAALFAGAFASACSAVVIASQSDPSSLNWPLVLLPVVAVPLPVFVSGRSVRVAAAAVMGVWCWLTGFSLGIFFVPCLLLMIGAASRDDE